MGKYWYKPNYAAISLKPEFLIVDITQLPDTDLTCGRRVTS